MRVLALMLAAVVALAGCSGSDTSSDSTTTATSAAGTGTSTGTGTTSASSTTSSSTTTAAPNQPPTATLEANNLTGAAPLGVTFRLSGSDPDGDKLAWVLDFGDGDAVRGDSLPANRSHTFAAAGNFTVTLGVHDGEAGVNQTVTVKVTAGGPSGPVPPPLVWTGTSSNTPAGCLVAASSDESRYYYFDPAYAGLWKYKATTTSPVPGALYTEWWAGDTSAGDGGTEGVIPEGADNVAVCIDTMAAPTDFKLVLYHPAGTPPA